MPGGSSPALSVSRVGKTFADAGRTVQALAEVSFEIPYGRVTGLIGPDGAGKTTLMRLIAGLLVPDAGRITVLGRDATQDVRASHAVISYMPQRFGLYEDLKVQENLDLYADLQGVPGDARPGRFTELMGLTGLGPFTDRLAGKLSGGMKQKLGLACTLVRPPQLLLLDEPTVGVDPISRRELWRIVYRLVEEQGMSVLLSTAYLDEAERCDEVVLLHDGRLLGQGTPQSFKARVTGRTYGVSASALNNRVLQWHLQPIDGVIDTVIQAGHVRVVTAEPQPPRAAALSLAAGQVRIKPLAPRFEDAFIAELRRTQPQDGDRGRLTWTDAPAAASSGEHDTVIEVREVSRRFGDFYAVRDLSFDVRGGEIFGLLGANGAGKTTTFRMLCGLLPASAGALTVAGVDLRKAASVARARLGYMAQRFSLYGELSVRENLRFFSAAYGLRGRRSRERIAWALEEFELTALTDVRSKDLPQGYKQRLAMACALMHEPEILFLDEPTSGVDPLARREFWRRISVLAHGGVTVLVTTHFLEEADYCDRLAIMGAGRILTLGEPAAIKAAAVTPANPDPSLEDAFVDLIERDTGARAA